MNGLTEHILTQAPVAIVCLDLEGRILFANSAAASMMGSDSVTDLQGQPIRSYIQFVNLSTNGQEDCIRDDGTRFSIEYTSAPVIEHERRLGTILTLRDVTERRAADRCKAELISLVSHELRTPLTSIRSSLGLLSSGHLGATPITAQRMLEIAVNNTDRLIRLVSDMLDLERLDSGVVHFERSACSAGELMLEATDSVRALAESAWVCVHVAPSVALVRGDRDRLLQVLINLLTNAIKFSPDSGGTVWLDAEEGPGELVFRVRDEGRGIPPEKLEAIFERFAQVEPSDAREKLGAGLGLSISRAIVEQHGGQIWAESTLGAGTTVCVALPTAARAGVEDVDTAA